MRKLQESGKADVKREVVSASNSLEVISQESFVKRLEGMSSACHNCQRERTRSQRNKAGRKGKPGRRKQQSKSNTPIVVYLKDTLRSAGKQRQSSLDGDSDVSARSTDEEQGGPSSRRTAFGNRNFKLGHQFSSVFRDVSSIPEFIPRHRGHHFHQGWSQTLYHHAAQTIPTLFHSSANHISPYHSFHSNVQRDTEKSRKNLTALISVIEKAHMKEPKDIEPNLSRNSTDRKLCDILNNSSRSTQNDSEVKRKNMADCENVELICNDLSNNAGKLAESTDESDSSDKASVLSSSDTLSDDVTDLPVLDEIRGHGFTADELEQLAQYTTGVPLIRYDCPPLQCPECVSAFCTYQYFQYEGYNMFTAARPSLHHSSAQPYIYACAKQQQQQQQQPKHQSADRSERRQQKTTTHRLSTSSESDALSDIDRSSTVSSSSSLSTSSSSSSAGDIQTARISGLPNIGTETSKTSRNADQPSEEIPHKRPVKRATASWKVSQHKWDGDEKQASQKLAHKQDDDFPDSVYVDLTGLDVSFSVVYYSESAHDNLVWFHPTHSIHQNLYSTPRSALNSSLNFRFTNNQMIYSDMIPAHEFKKYEMSMPPSRPWIPTGVPDKAVPAAVFSVMCYNVLCDKLCTKSMYAYCPTWALNWDYRKKGIMSDILRGNADIITLQEVETEQYYSMFLAELAQQGYDGVFLPKSRVRTMSSDKEKKTVDGCAIFFKKSKFAKVNEYHIEFSQLATKDGASNTDTDMINRVSTKDNIALVALLRTKPAAYDNSPVTPPKGLSQMLMVSTAHIHWDPQSPDVKLVQTMMLIEELQKCVREASLKFRPNAPPPPLDTDLCNSMPLILCGDFNSLPDSGVYEFLSKGKLYTNHKDFEGQNYQVFMKDRNDNGIISHNFKLTSAYKDVIPFTNYTFDFKGIIDYIFYSDKQLRLHGVMGLQDEEWFRVNKIVGCPHPFVPSDHFPLFAEFSLPAPPQRPR